MDPMCNVIVTMEIYCCNCWQLHINQIMKNAGVLSKNAGSLRRRRLLLDMETESQKSPNMYQFV